MEPFLERFEEEVDDPEALFPLRIETKYVDKKDTAGECTYIYLSGGYVIVEDWRERWTLYETAERTAERKHLSDWANFARGTWVKGPPTKPGLYPVRSKTGRRGKDREIVEIEGRIKDVSGGYVASGKVTEWVGDWWSDPFPPLPGAV